MVGDYVPVLGTPQKSVLEMGGSAPSASRAHLQLPGAVPSSPRPQACGKPTPSPPAKGGAWRTEMSAQGKFQIRMYSGSLKHSGLKFKKKKRQQQKLSTWELPVLQFGLVAIQVQTQLSSWDLPSLSSWDSTALHPELEILLPAPHRYLSQLNCCSKDMFQQKLIFSPNSSEAVRWLCSMKSGSTRDARSTFLTSH